MSVIFKSPKALQPVNPGDKIFVLSKRKRVHIAVGRNAREKHKLLVIFVLMITLNFKPKHFFSWKFSGAIEAIMKYGPFSLSLGGRETAVERAACGVH